MRPPAPLPNKSAAHRKQDEEEATGMLLSLASIMDAKFNWKVKVNCLSVDLMTGHVKIQVRNLQPFWIPYVILHVGCRKESKKKWLRETIQRLMSKVSLLDPYPAWEYPTRPRLSVMQMHPIVLMYYWPEFRDGTIWGEHERVVYRLASTSTIGVSMLKDVRVWYMEAGQYTLLETFIDRKRVRHTPTSLRTDLSDYWLLQVQILKCGEDVGELRKAMGLTQFHTDITVPQMRDYEFKHFHFGMGTPRKSSTLEESVQALVRQHSDGKSSSSSSSSSKNKDGEQEAAAAADLLFYSQTVSKCG